jgi:hypothetical protein
VLSRPAGIAGGKFFAQPAQLGDDATELSLCGRARRGTIKRMTPEQKVFRLEYVVVIADRSAG